MSIRANSCQFAANLKEVFEVTVLIPLSTFIVGLVFAFMLGMIASFILVVKAAMRTKK